MILNSARRWSRIWVVHFVYNRISQVLNVLFDNICSSVSHCGRAGVQTDQAVAVDQTQSVIIGANFGHLLAESMACGGTDHFLSTVKWPTLGKPEYAIWVGKFLEETDCGFHSLAIKASSIYVNVFSNQSRDEMESYGKIWTINPQTFYLL